jgi:hypothetical protein
MTTKQQFVEWFNKYYEDRNWKDDHNIDDERLAIVLKDFKYEVDGEMFDYYIEYITDASY